MPVDSEFTCLGREIMLHLVGLFYRSYLHRVRLHTTPFLQPCEFDLVSKTTRKHSSSWVSTLPEDWMKESKSFLRFLLKTAALFLVIMEKCWLQVSTGLLDLFTFGWIIGIGSWLCLVFHRVLVRHDSISHLEDGQRAFKCFSCWEDFEKRRILCVA